MNQRLSARMKSSGPFVSDANDSIERIYDRALRQAVIKEWTPLMRPAHMQGVCGVIDTTSIVRVRSTTCVVRF